MTTTPSLSKRRCFALALAFLVVAGTAVLAPAAANHSLATEDPWEPDDRLSRDGSGRDGWVIDLDGDTAISGMPAVGTDDPGDAIVFVRDASDNWSQQARLTAPGTEDFGWTVALDGDTALVGDPEAGDGGNGAAYVFARDSGGQWTLQATLLPDDGSTDEFGESVDLHGGTALVGAPDAGSDHRGAAYVFTHQGNGDWPQQARLSQPDTGDAGFGVAIQGDRAVVGDPDHRDQRARAGEEDPPTGAAFVYERDAAGAWTLQATVTGERHGDLTEDTRLEPGDETEFGRSVDLDGDTLAVGDPEGYATPRDFVTNVRFPLFDDRQAGVLYTFVEVDGNWTQQARLFESRGDVDQLGRDLDLEGDTLIPGRFADPPVYVRQDGAWAEEDRLTVPEEDRLPRDRDPSADSRVGYGGIALEDGRALVGGVSSDESVVFEFERTG